MDQKSTFDGLIDEEMDDRQNDILMNMVIP